jgi:hypothetical protein
MAWQLCTKEDVMSLVTTNQNRLPDFWSDTVEDMIREHISSPFLGQTQVIVAEKHDGDGGAVLIPFSLPVATVQSLLIGETVLDPALYSVSDIGVSLLEGTFPVGQKNITVSYTTKETVPAIVSMTAAMMIVSLFNFKGREGADNSMVWGDADAKKGNTNLFTEIGLHQQLDRIMKKMLKRNRVRVY